MVTCKLVQNSRLHHVERRKDSWAASNSYRVMCISTIAEV